MFEGSLERLLHSEFPAADQLYLFYDQYVHTGALYPVSRFANDFRIRRFLSDLNETLLDSQPHQDRDRYDDRGMSYQREPKSRHARLWVTLEQQVPYRVLVPNHPPTGGPDQP